MVNWLKYFSLQRNPECKPLIKTGAVKGGVNGSVNSGQSQVTERPPSPTPVYK